MSMLTSLAMGQAVAAPVTMAVLFGTLLRRSANAWFLLAAFVCGGLGAFSLNTSILRQLPSMLPPDQIQAVTATQAWLSGFVDAAIPEEAAKGIWMLVLLVGWSRYSAGHGPLIGGLVGLGFALRENLSFAQIAPEWRVMAAVSHGAWGVVMGGLLEAAVNARRRRALAIVGAFVPTILLHGVLDASIFLVEAHEAQTGLDPADFRPEDVLSPALLGAMLLTWAMELTSAAWAFLVIRRVRRQPAPIPDRVAPPPPEILRQSGPDAT